MDKEPSTPERSWALKLTKTQVAIILILFAALLLAVGLLAGLLKPGNVSPPVRQVAAPSAGALEPWLKTRLPRHVLPVHYDLTLYPDFYRPDQDEPRFYGNVSILVNITSEPARHLVFHANKLTIHQTAVSLLRSEGNTQEDSVPVRRTFNFTDNQYWVIELDRDLQPGSTVRLNMRFEGPMGGRLNGLYRTSYVDSRSLQKRFHLSPSSTHHHLLLCSSAPLFPHPALLSPKFFRVPLGVGGWPIGLRRANVLSKLSV